MSYQFQAVDRAVFRAYDIRGIIDERFGENAFFTIGLAVGTKLRALGQQDIYMARDGRLTSERLAKALAAGLLATGANVFDLEAVATPVMYFATCSTEIHSGLMVTGSHNPADYNGIKMVLSGKTLVQEDIDELYTIIQNQAFVSGDGHYQVAPILPAYLERILSDIKLKKPLKVVVDCGNGIAGATIPSLLSALGCEVIPLFCEVDGHFPNHHPDPTIEANLHDLKAEVLAKKADIGLAFDGDADRLGVVTDKAQVIWPDRLMMLYAQYLLKAKPNATIVFDVKCSANLGKIIEKSGGVPRMCPTGHSIVKGIMKEAKAELAGEMSGHLFFKDRWYGFDDALYSACRLLEILSESDLTVSEQFSSIPDSVNTPEIKIAIAEEHKFNFMQQFAKTAEFPEASIIRIDGLRVEFPQGWGLLRASNTTPCLVARFEAQDVDSLEAIKQAFRLQLHRVDSTLMVDF